ncbi:MAG TPA: PQQ-dependent dehydrogenase, methanol/ethanol family [Bryobacteraceae bacterium]|nr:PQQ-dependent dehydrogenase, methanol/ethanol family [Bryobacteraceae bacterium]
MKALRLLIALAAASLWAQQDSGPVTFDRILHADREPQNWLTYSGNLSGQRHSLLTQITPENVNKLELQWVFQAKSLEKFEATPIVVNGVLYTVQPPDDVIALDAATGRIFWTLNYSPHPKAGPCCGRVNRGLAILGDTLYLGTIDAHLLAIDAKNGQVLWNVAVAPVEESYAITHAPLIVKDKVIIGTAGGDRGAGGIIAAYDAKTGKEDWRFHTIPQPGEPGHESWSGESWKRGGAAIWNTGSYDPATNLTFWGTGNPAPDWDGRQRLGDNLYSDSVLALDADTGKLKWYYQFTPHDEVDYDATQVAVLADIDWKGAPRKAMLWANRNGLMYVFDRTTGEFLSGKPFVEVNWMSGFDEKGRPMRVPGKLPSAEGTLIKPTVLGATNWYPPSYNPHTGLFYIPSWENTATMAMLGAFPKGVGQNPMGGVNLQANFKNGEDGNGAIQAFDPKTGERKWNFPMSDITWGGVLTTESDLLFSGGREGYFFALDDRTGKLLWKVSLGGQMNSGPMSFAINGKQYIAVNVGTALFTFALPQ